MVKNCVAVGCKSTYPDIVSFLNSRAMTTVGSSGFGKCGELTIVGTDRLSIAFCAKGILVKIASSLRQLWYQLWEYSGGKKLNPDAIPTIFEHPKPTGTSHHR